jgi:hypothetical protein
MNTEHWDKLHVCTFAKEDASSSIIMPTSPFFKEIHFDDNAETGRPPRII